MEKTNETTNKAEEHFFSFSKNLANAVGRTMMNSMYEEAANSTPQKGEEVTLKKEKNRISICKKIMTEDGPAKDETLFAIPLTRKAEEIEVAGQKIQTETPEVLENLISDGKYRAFLAGTISGNKVNICVRVIRSSDAPKVAISNTIIEDTAKRTGLTIDEVKEREKLILSYGVKKGTRTYAAILGLIARQPEGKNITKPDLLYQQDKTNKVIFEMLIRLIHGGNVCLEGNKSVGKNVAWETISYLLNCKLFALQCDENMTLYDVFGSTSTDNSISDDITIDKVKSLMSECDESIDSRAELKYYEMQTASPKLVFSPGIITRAMMHSNAGYGAIALLDEMNLSEPAVFSSAFNVLTDKHTPTVQISGYGEMKIPKSLIFGGTQNGVEGDFMGTKKQNDASMSRWAVITIKNGSTIMPLLKTSEAAEYVLVEDLERIDAVYCGFLNLVKQGLATDCVLNVRGFKRVVEDISECLTLERSVEMNVINSIPDLQTRTALMEIVRVC